MKAFVKSILLIAVMALGLTGAWAQDTPQHQSDDTWKFTMPSGNRLLDVEYKQPCGLAWQNVPDDGVIGYFGFESFVTFPTLDNPYSLDVTYSSENTNVATINEDGDVITFTGTGTTRIKASFADNGNYLAGDDEYILIVNNPPTLTLTVNDLQMGSVELIEGSRIVDLSTVTADYTAQDGDILTGTLDVANHPVKISVADGAKVTLHNVTIDGISDLQQIEWAGITCLGNATLILSGTNTVKGFYSSYPGIYVSTNKTLTLQGSGSLNASSNGWAAGIGGGYAAYAPELYCGNIVIKSGIITATGGQWAAGIGSGYKGSCGTITITGGTVTATKGAETVNSIGSGKEGSCGTVTIGGTVYWDGTAYQNGGDDATTGLVQETYTYNGTGNTPYTNVIENPDGSYSVYPGTNVTLVATYNAGYHLASWSNISGNALQQTVTVDQTMTITATFAADPVLTLAVNDAQMGYAAIESTPAFGALAKSFNCSSDYQYGVFTDGTYIYTSSWSTRDRKSVV